MMKLIGELEFKDDWNGGAVTIAGVRPGSSNMPREFFVSASKTGKRVMYPAKIVPRYGADSDHGHTYRWENIDVLFGVSTEFGEHWISCLSCIKSKRKVYVFQES